MHTPHCPFRGYEDSDVFRVEFYSRKRPAKDVVLTKDAKANLVAGIPEEIAKHRKLPKSERLTKRRISHS
jgi:hypothetical protein